MSNVTATRRFPRPVETDRMDRFEEVVSSHEEFSIIITQVDPDALGSAFGMLHLLGLFNKQGSIYYCGGFAHPQNRAIANKYNLKSKMLPIKDLPDDIPTILVDSSLGKDGRMGDIEIDPIIVVDHHRGSNLKENGKNFIWIEDVGSACTLIIELLLALSEKHPNLIETERGLSPAEYVLDQNRDIALLLAMGIYKDSKELMSATHRDRDAYGYACRFVKKKKIKQLIDYPLPASHFKNLAKALNKPEERGSYLVAGVGVIDSSNGDDLSTIADYFLRKDGISLVIVWGIIDGAVRISARNSDLSTPLDDFLKARFGEFAGAKLTPDGRGEGGAMLKLDLGIWDHQDVKDELENMVRKRIHTWIFPSTDD